MYKLIMTFKCNTYSYLKSILAFFFIAGISNAQIGYEVSFPNLSFEYPTEIQTANDGTDRLFVVEQAGSIKVFQNDNNVMNSNTFLDISNIVSFSSGQEIGLLGLAFHPNYKENRYFYVYHTKQSGLPNVNVEIALARYTSSVDNPNQADQASRLEIFSFDKNQSNSNHNGGKIGFGPDGYLYISVGDGGGGGDPNKNAQNLNNVFGSILRIDVDLDGNNPLETNPDLPNGNYEIPMDNPRFGQDGLEELYAWGIRNTWKFSFDKVSGRMWGADVGQGDREEINIIENGGNYGWSRFEGNTLEDGSTVLTTNPDIKPIFEYTRDNGDISITGGYVYSGPINNNLINGKYIYGDYVSGRVWALDYNVSSGMAISELLFRTNGQYISSFGQDESGNLYFSDYGTSSQIYKLVGDSDVPPSNSVDGVGNWYGIEEGINGTVTSLAVANDGKIYIGGEFSRAGNIDANNLAFYDPDFGWGKIGEGTNGKINSVAISTNGNIYVGGDFTQIDDISANNIAVWDGSTWSALEQGTNGSVNIICASKEDHIFVGGAFEMAGGMNVNNIALWNRNVWTPLTSISTNIPGTNNEIRAISLDENNMVYVGGNFDNAGGIQASRIALWNGSNWNNLGEGTSGFVQAIFIMPDYIYIGGNFVNAGNKTVNRVAKWNRNSLDWESLGKGLSGNVNVLSHDGNYLYVGGNFETVSDLDNTSKIVSNISRWSQDIGWEALGQGTNVGVDNLINTLAPYDENNGFYVGGNFSKAGQTNANNLAIWSESVIILPSPNTTANLLYPNPFVDDVQIIIENSSSDKVFASLYTISGMLISSNTFYIQNGIVTINFPPISNGLYYLKITSEDIEQAYKLIKK
jgi:glucose/arabinose dehydrogenase